jgi:hypothetical protein
MAMVFTPKSRCIAACVARGYPAVGGWRMAAAVGLRGRLNGLHVLHRAGCRLRRQFALPDL